MRLFIFLLSLSVAFVASMASAAVSTLDDDHSWWTADQQTAAKYGQAINGNILICELIDRTAGKVLAENAMNPEFGFLPNYQMKIASGNQTGLVTFLSNTRGTVARLRLDIESVEQDVGADFKDKVALLTPKTFSQTSKTFASVTLSTSKNETGKPKTYGLTCRGSYGVLQFSSDD
jgi:hypothetical protein